MATYNPNNGTPSNKPFSVQGKPEVGRQYYFDFGASNRWRMYQSTAEILSYLDTPIKREGHPFFVVNTGGTLSNGIITGGTNELWWFKNGTADGDLVRIVSDVVIPNLQSVTDIGNKSTNAFQLTGNGNYDTNLNAFSFGYAAGVGILNVKSGLGNTGIAITGQGATVSVDGETVFNLSKPSASSGVAGRVSGRLKIADGTESDDAITKSQFENRFEIIPFAGSTGIINIDLTINNRNTLFPNVDLRAYNVEVINATTKKETQIVGCVPKITEVSGVNTSLSVSYIAGDGYILLTNN